MKVYYLIILLLFVFPSVCLKAQDKGSFTINGEAKSKEKQEIILSYSIFKNNKYEEIRDTAQLKDGLFSMVGYLSEPVKANLIVGDKSFPFYIDPVKINLSIHDGNKVTIAGGKTQNDYELLNKSIEDILNKSAYLEDQFCKLDILAENGSNLDSINIEKDKIRSLSTSLNNERGKRYILFMSSNKDSFVSMDLLIDVYQRNLLTLNEARDLFNSFSPQIKNTVLGNKVNKHLSKYENTSVGSMAPDFKAKDINDRDIQLSQFRGEKFVLLDFWATWCGPCIQGIPALREINKMYQDKGLILISISCDFDKKDWISGVEKFKMKDWTNLFHVSDVDSWLQGKINDEDISEKYPTMGIPRYFLIDKEGQIIGKWYGYSEDNEKELQSLLQKVL